MNRPWWNSIRSFALLTSLVLATAPATAATKVFLLGGQSNMAGLGAWPGPPAQPACPGPYNAEQTAVQFWNYGTHQTVNGFDCPGTGDGWVNLQPGYGYNYTTEFGPEVSFGYRLHERYPDDNIYLVKLGLTDQSLAGGWNPNGTGAVYNVFKARVEAAIKNLNEAHLNPEIAGMIWMQGESDALNATYAANYQTNLKAFIETVRSDFAATDMPFVIGRILTYYDTNPTGSNALVRSAQESIPSLPGVNHVTCINTDNLQCAYGGHYGTQGQIDLGIRFANAIPEPGALALLGIGMISVLTYVWSIRK